MSGEPPHQSHNRQIPPWDYIGMPNYYPRRQLQHAHMSSEHSLLHQPTWHTPTTENMKSLPHPPHLFGLHHPLTQSPGVDLSVTSQNGDSTSPISLSVRDTNKINSLPPSALNVQAVELTKNSVVKVSPNNAEQSKTGAEKTEQTKTEQAKVVDKNADVTEQTKTKEVDETKTVDQTTKNSVDLTKTSVDPKISGDHTKTASKKHKPLVSVLERLKPIPVEQSSNENSADSNVTHTHSVIVQASSNSHDENSNSSSIVNVPTPGTLKDEEVASPCSNEDSLDSSKSRRKRKPSKTMRCSKDGAAAAETTDDTSKKDRPENDIEFCVIDDGKAQDPNSQKVREEIKNTNSERRRSSDDIDDLIVPAKTRRKTSSESETIDNIAAMVQETLREKAESNATAKAVSVSVIKNAEPVTTPTLVTPAQKKEINTHFVEVENKLEEMFAGIDDTKDPLQTDNLDLSNTTFDESLTKTSDPLAASNQEKVSSTSGEVLKKSTPKKRKKTQSRTNSRRNSSETETTPKIKLGKKLKTPDSKSKSKIKSKKTKLIPNKTEIVKENYDSCSNASSSKSRGPYIHIKGPRDSPIAVNVINVPSNEEDLEKKAKTKKFHDDSEYRHKVRSKGLHSSTLSNKYDAQTKDATWICVFCKRGPHITETSADPDECSFSAGDLFGPYFITTNCSEFERRLDDPYDRNFKSKKVVKMLEGANSMKVSGKKSKRKHSDSDGQSSDPYLGISETDGKTYEIWAHEDCIVWAPGTYLIGPKIVGLEEAVWTSCNVSCDKCHFKGANICCIKRGCVSVQHIWCAKTSNWRLDEENFKAYCNQHWAH